MTRAVQRPVAVRPSDPDDFEDIADLCRRVYPETSPWSIEQLTSDVRIFPDGQFVALFEDQRVVGMSSSLIIDWDHYDMFDSWEDFTSNGTLTNHDPVRGQTLYGVELIVDPELQGHGIGHKLVIAQKELATRQKLLRMRGGARLRDYHRYADRMTPADYTIAVVHGQIVDATLSFHLHEGFHVIAVVPHYLTDDSETLGYAALVEWLNPDRVEPAHYANRPTRFLHRDVVRELHRSA